MTTPLQGDRDKAVWDSLVQAHSSFLAASRDFFSEGIDRAALVRAALREGKDKFAACHVLRQLSPEELKGLFDVLVDWASTGHGLVHVFRDAILALPREWVLERIEETAEPYLRNGKYDEYRRFLELYARLDRGLAMNLARRAAEHDDDEVAEAGQDFLQTLEQPNVPIDRSVSRSVSPASPLDSLVQRPGRLCRVAGHEGLFEMIPESSSESRAYVVPAQGPSDAGFFVDAAMVSLFH